MENASRLITRFLLNLLLSFVPLLPLSGFSAESTGENQQIIVVFRKACGIENPKKIEKQLIDWHQRFGVRLSVIGPFRSDRLILKMQDHSESKQIEELIEQMNRDACIKYAEIDAIMRIQRPSTD